MSEKIKTPVTKTALVGYALTAAGIIYSIVLLATRFAGISTVDFFGDAMPKEFLLLFPFCGMIGALMLIVFTRMPKLMTFPVPVTEQNRERLLSLTVSAFALFAALEIWMFTAIFLVLLNGTANLMLPIIIAGGSLTFIGYAILHILYKKTAKEEV